MKRICTFLVILAVLLSMAAPAFAAGTVTYAGNAQKFIFAPGSEYSPTDLFSDFKEMMPGDKRTQQIFIKNDIANEVKIKLYMRSKGAEAGSEAFLSQLKLSVAQAGASILFDAPADQSAQLTDWVYLGTIYSGGEITLNVTLEVPITLGNDFQNAIGYLNWEFMIEELPVEPTDPEPPKTGDETPVTRYLMLVAISAVGIFLLIVLNKKRKEVEEANRQKREDANK